MTGKWLTINRGNQHSLRKLVILWLVSWRLIGHLLAGTNLFFHVIYLAGKKWILIPSFSHLFSKNNYKMNLEMGEVDGWIPDWFPKVEKEESRKWEPVDGIQEKIICLQHFVFLFIYELETWSSSYPFLSSRAREEESMAAREKRKRLVAAIDWFRNSTKGVSYEDMKVEFL